MPWETKDFVTMGLSIAATIGTVSLAYWQYSLNVDRDIREQKTRIEDRTPIVTITATRDNAQRQYNVSLDIKNRPVSTVAIETVELLDAPYELSFPSEQGRVKATHAYAGIAADMRKLRFEKNEIDVNERFTWNCTMTVPDRFGIESGKVVKFRVTFRAYDNADTLLVTTRELKLN